jgi:hypothetical protein
MEITDHRRSCLSPCYVECWDLLVNCQERRICLCNLDEHLDSIEQLYEHLQCLVRDHEEANHYRTWSPGNLKSLAKFRNLPLPTNLEDSELPKLLRQSDTQHTFRLMDLPLELRHMIYSEVFYGNQVIDVTKIRSEQTSLLRTSHQIRDEATPIFFNEPRFLFTMSMINSTNNFALVNWEHHHWLDLIGPGNIEMIRHLSFYSRPDAWRHRLRIDLDDLSDFNWVITTSSLLACTGFEPKVRSLGQVREYFGDIFGKESDPSKRVIDAVDAIDESISIAHVATQNFQARYGAGKSVVPTIEGFHILARAAWEILHLTDQWNRPLSGKFDDYALDDEIPEDEVEADDGGETYSD